MARKINSKLKISGTLLAETPLHVGGYGESADTDMPLAKNGNGNFYIPGTSICGILRAWCKNNFVNNNFVDIDSIFGYQVGDQGHASFVLIEDIELDKNLQSEIRDGVGIDRFYGTAADKTKFDRAILPKGSMLKFEITVEIKDAESSPRTKAIFGHLLDALQKSEIHFGASKTRGLGKVKLTNCEIKSYGLVGFNDILSFLSGEGKTCTIQGLKDALPTLKPTPAKPKLEITICWKPTLPLMNKAGYEGIGVDMLPVTSGVEDGKLSLVLAGSSIKGAFRSQAERIIRTLKGLQATGEFNEQVKVPIVQELFGGKKEKNATNPKLRLGALSIDDCYAKDEFSMKTEDWRNVEQGKFDNEATFSQTELHQALKKIDGESNDKPSKRFAISHHTAIDRFTGGVADGALYSVLAPHNIEWQPIKMSLDFGRTDGNDKCCLMLLLLVLRDLAENRLPLGFATNRGMGEIEVDCIKLKCQTTEIGLPKDLDVTLTKGNVKHIDNEIKEALKGALGKWINANQDK